MTRTRVLSGVTIADVARRAGVSIATVSRVVNRAASVAPETVARVEAAIAELSYIPRAAARSLPSHRTQVIGLLLPEIGWDNFFPPMLRGIENAAAEGGFDLLIYSTHAGARGDQRPRRPIGEHNTDGLLVFPDGLESSEIARFHQSGFPMVLLHFSAPDGMDIPHVAFENKAGSRRMVDHLIEAHGYRRIAFLAGPQDNEDSRWRLAGYLESLEAHGLGLDGARVGQGGFDARQAQSAVEAWLAEGVEIDAVFAADDDSAIGAIRALQQAGRPVPEAMAVVGFDDVPTARYLTPPLTTVRAPIEESGYQAARMLVRLIRDGHAELPPLFPTELVIRRSCGCL